MKRLAVLLLALVVPLTGAGAAALKYTCQHDYFEAKPAGQQLGPCHGGVVIDRAGNVYVTTDTKRGIVVFSADGKYSVPSGRRISTRSRSARKRAWSTSTRRGPRAMRW